MISYIGRYIFYFILLMLVQVLILNNLNLGGYINPYMYVLFLLILPVEIPGWILMLIGFLTGLIMDAFLNTIGIHASAMVFLSFLRPWLLRILAPRDGYEPGSLPIPSHFGFSWFLKYTFLAVIAHHAFLFYVEVFTFEGFFGTLWRVSVSALFTTMFVMLAQLFGSRNEKRI
jgi:rod shape-determining protein MreD